MTTRTRFRTRRGRPPIAPRKPDKGTPELQEKRAAGSTSEVLDCLHRQQLLTDGEYRAALHLRWLYRLRFGRPHICALDLHHSPHAAPTHDNAPDWHLARQQEYRHAMQRLTAIGAWEICLKVAVFDEPISPPVTLQHARLKQGLTLLATCRLS